MRQISCKSSKTSIKLANIDHEEQATRLSTRRLTYNVTISRAGFALLILVLVSCGHGVSDRHLREEAKFEARLAKQAMNEGDCQSAMRHYLDAAKTIEFTSYTKREARYMGSAADAADCAGESDKASEYRRRSADLEGLAEEMQDDRNSISNYTPFQLPTPLLGGGGRVVGRPDVEPDETRGSPP